MKEPGRTDEMIKRFGMSHAKHSPNQVNGETQQTQSGKILEVNARRHQK
ncbi:YpzG family protein [Sporolactobacillus shoreicorticis]|uniref:YpzG family protein n=1 Tax=Sporolactobacillus shoreicorticis TaxID=1923877 RepID=A0ABW5S5N7_9BACL|nr:YpzG family protein [Sporolactobacillus shoreicorticis]MCO7128169.1 YpzG family protein [Sporolactobacillus shoreicorticis]